MPMLSLFDVQIQVRFCLTLSLLRVSNTDYLPHSRKAWRPVGTVADLARQAIKGRSRNMSIKPCCISI